MSALSTTVTVAIIVCLMASPTNADPDPVIERANLVRIYESCGGPKWQYNPPLTTASNDRWDPYNSSSNYCKWYGIYCNYHIDTNPLYGVSKILLAGVGMSGTLPGAAIANFTLMGALDFSNNSLTGTLPLELSTLSASLQVLSVFNTYISGTLPPEYGALVHLQYFNAWRMRITGTLPREYSTLVNLLTFDVTYNTINGTLPPEYSTWTSIQQFNTYETFISGTLPSSYGAWTSIVSFDVSRDSLLATAYPFSPVSDPNSISGTIPPEYEFWAATVITFHTYGNVIRGSLPPELGAWKVVQRFLHYNNLLTGALPPEYGSWGSSVHAFYVHNNFITGTLPPQYSQWSKVAGILVYNNSITGTIPETWGYFKLLTSLQLHLNKLFGSIPDSFGNLGSILSMNFALNNLSGTIPASAIANLRGVQSIGFQNNPFLGGSTLASWTHIFATGTFPLVSTCGTQICGPEIPALVIPPFTYGYGCLPPKDRSLMSLDAVATTALITLLGDVTWNLSLPCAAPHPRGSTVTVSKKLHPHEEPQQQAAPLAVHGVPLATSSFIISALAVQQLASIGSAAGAGVHTMQAALTIRRLRQMCDDGVNAENSVGGSGSGGDEATCCDAGMNPTQWNIDVSSGGGTDNSDSITPPFVGTLVGNTILLVGLGVLRLCGCRLFDYLSKIYAFESCGPRLRQMLDTICVAFFSCSDVAVFWSTFSFLVSPTISASAGLMSAAVSPATVVMGVF
ncbi:GP46-like surface antigen, putative, partial [Bodo saltans]